MAPDDLVIGTAAAGGGHHLDAGYPDPFTHDKKYRKLLAAEFSSVSPENQMKWDFIHPERGVYNFAAADAIVDFAEANGQVVRGHTLLWHSQLPAWVHAIEDPAELRAVLKDHIETVVGRYAGRIQQWDVANEIFADEWDKGGLRLRDGSAEHAVNPFIEKLGPGIIADAFRWAHAADPQAKLFLNDYAVEDWNRKSTAYYDLAKQLLAQKVPLHGFAFQAHLDLQYPFPSTLRANMQRFDDLGLETAITELDVRFTLPANGVPTDAQLAQQAATYQGVLEACLAVEDCNSFTIWGFNDKYSWVPGFFSSQGAATVMWEDYERKPAYHALHETLAAAQD
ncbi:endo-1,4-beta-xylanase [Blastococcus sp. PRF04-17]|uniref:endo-1,4-beta-xylanase n=1 Tax=Blastococcus sp. PRF04-17 TaxID=2933797 RepID=UPI001FF4A909|nr:endo-1,4-beta-xylanase [Blastococcus sp. PRF04-17]UOY02631.1 endo-1,4-beta-xylanase [Blastococcus sp. PRF04-17]